MNRRHFLIMSSLSLAAAPLSAHARQAHQLHAICRELERQSGGRLGVYLYDGRASTKNEQEFLYNGETRFPMCSIFKWLLAAAVLRRVESGQDRLDRKLRFSRQDLLEYSPTTEAHADGPGMSLAQLCEGAVADSDNTAANLLLDALGGLPEFNAFLRAQGDSVTRLDRLEPMLNEARPGDPRDTSTPAAMGANLRRLLLGDGLSPASRQQLKDWMLSTRTSGARLRADLETGWQLADKTGTGGNGTTNDVGIYWTPTGEPIVLCVFLTAALSDRAAQSATIAAIGRAARASA
ncbi:MAG: class A beta-lactamase [Rhodocyclales bacterium]|nr:class A beta-lactamase [Rhodocyclales bacterium]